MEDMICVYTAANVTEADIVAAWLEQQSIKVHIKDRFVAEALGLPQLFTPGGIAVCVVDPGEAERAKALLGDHLHDLRHEGPTAPSGELIEVTCEECRKTTSFPFEQRERVETCPHCGNTIDVPKAAYE